MSSLGCANANVRLHCQHGRQLNMPSPANPQVLSVVAQQLLTIQNALKAGLDKFWFEGRPIRLVPTCGTFITMNPVGEVKLPPLLV